MPGDKAASAARTPAKATRPAATASSATKQKSIMSFFQKSSPVASSPAAREKVSSDIHYSSPLKETKANSLPKTKFFAELSTPVPSSDALEPTSSQENMESTVKRSKVKFAEASESEVAPSSPIRKVCVAFSPGSFGFSLLTDSVQGKKAINYAESSDEDDEPFAYGAASQTRRRGRARNVVNDEDDYGESDTAEQEDEGSYPQPT